jgi:hypothetical protein
VRRPAASKIQVTREWTCKTNLEQLCPQLVPLKNYTSKMDIHYNSKAAGEIRSSVKRKLKTQVKHAAEGLKVIAKARADNTHPGAQLSGLTKASFQCSTCFPSKANLARHRIQAGSQNIR